MEECTRIVVKISVKCWEERKMLCGSVSRAESACKLCGAEALRSYLASTVHKLLFFILKQIDQQRPSQVSDC